MQQSPSFTAVDTQLGRTWAQQWFRLISEVSPHTAPDAAERILALTTQLLRHASLPLAEQNPVAIIRIVETTLSYETLGVPPPTAQLFGMLALADALGSVTPEERRNCWRRVAIPWLQHPFFSISAIHALSSATDQTSVIASLVTNLSQLACHGTATVWRYIDDESPLIEITATSTGRTGTLESMPEIATAVHSGEVNIVENRMFVPVCAEREPFAIIEVSAREGACTTLLLHTLALAQVAEIALQRVSQREQINNSATWQRILTNLAGVLTVTHSADDVLTTLSHQIRIALPCERIAYWEYQPQTDEFVVRALSARLTAAQATVGSRCPASDTPMQVVWHTGQPLLLTAADGWRFRNYTQASLSMQAMMVLPLVFEYQSLGVLTIERLDPRPFTRQDQDWLTPVCSLVAAALHNIEIHQALYLAQQRLVEDTKMRALGEMAAGIAHDFNNLLMGMMCHVDLLGYAPGLKEVKARLPRLESAIMDARTIIQRISTFGRLDAQEQLTPLDLCALLRDCGDWLLPQLRQNHVELEMQSSCEMWVAGVASELREVLINLITNAIHAMPHGGILTLACGQTSTHAWISVTDTGIGMSPAVLARACDPFFSTKGGTGTGLGLSVSYSIMQRHHGSLTLESEEGVGTTVRLVLPIETARHHVAVEEGTDPTGLQILLVEDNVDIAAMLRELLTHLGHHCTAVVTVHEGVTQCRCVRYDMIITDLALAGDTGDAVAVAAKQHQPDTPVLLISGSLSSEPDTPGLYAGRLRKPLSLEALRKAIRTFAGRAGADAGRTQQ